MSRVENTSTMVVPARRRFWNVPNTLTVSRLVLAPTGVRRTEAPATVMEIGGSGAAVWHVGELRPRTIATFAGFDNAASATDAVTAV